jgi:small-conductance mechanosensitive channel
MEQKVVEIKRKLSFLETKLLIERAKRKVLQEQRANIKEGLRVDESDVVAERASLERKRQTHLEARDKLYTVRKNLELERDKLKSSLEEWAKKLNITVTDLRSLDDMAIQLKTAENYFEFSALLNIKEQISLLDKKIELHDAHIKSHDAKFDRDRVAVNSIESWNKLTMRRFRTEADVELEINRYQEPLKEAELEITSLTEKRATATNFLNLQNKVIESLRDRIRQLRGQEQLFQNHPMDYYRSGENFAGAQRLAYEQIEINRQIIEIYSKTIQIRTELKNNAQMMIDELQSIGLRPPHAISFEGLRNIVADLVQAKNEMVNLGAAYFAQCAPSVLWKKIHGYGLLGIAWFLLKLLTLGFIFLLIRFVLPLFAALVHRVTRDAGTGLLLVGRFIEGVIEFAQDYYAVLFAWIGFYIALHHDVVCDLFPRIIFYLVSIPLSLWLGRRAIRFFIAYNKEQGYLFISDLFVDRIASIAQILLYATGTIFFFREAFMLASYSKSELPTILLAIYSVIVRIVLISLVRKEDILEVMPEKGMFWTWARTHVEEHFYSVYAAIVALFILSEPHIGFGKQISYLLWGVIGTVLLFRGVLLLHEFIKRTSSLLFFTQDTEQYRERFAHAQKLYGVFIIGTFVIISFLAVIIGAKIWGYSVSFSDIYDLFNKELFALGEGTIDRREITLFSILQLISYFFGSFMVAWAVNQLILRRIYDLLIVEPGVQHTVSTLVHYLIVLTIIMLGFQRIGLGKVVPVLLLSLAIAIYWPLRDHVNDFVSYFIILVQRPFKIGDYVQIDDGVQGVVRKITPRSVIVREKNSVTVLVPNSKVITGTISNWNYVRSFVATPDLFISVGYSADPVEVRTLLHRVLDASIHVLKNPRPIIRLDEFGEHGFVFLIRPFISVDNVPQRLDIASDLRFAFVKALRERGIEVMPLARITKVKSSD